MQRFMRPSAIVIGLVVASLLLAHVSGGPIGAPAVRDRGLRLDPTNKFTRVGVPAGAALRSRASLQTATIDVTYVGFTPEAQAAFEHAVDIWSSLVVATVPITVHAEFVSLTPGVLGGAGAVMFARDFPGAPEANVWFPIALANQYEGSDLDPLTFDIEAVFSSSVTNWYFGTDGNTPENSVDFVSTVLHEIAHGLGFAGSMDVVSGSGSWQTGTSTLPSIYDWWSINGSSQFLTDVFANPSTDLATELQSDNLFWGGPQAFSANGSLRPQLYAPEIWEPGSSFSHLEESIYPAGNANSLMTYAIGFAESIHNPGPITIGMLKDLGWTTGCSFALSSTSASGGPAGGSGSFNVIGPAGCAWSATSNAGFITITSGGAGSGPGAVGFSFTPNTLSASRTGTISAGDNTFTLTQSGVACSHGLSSSGQSGGPAGFTGSLTVTATASDCSRSASSNAAWLTITAGATGAGTGTVSFAAAQNVALAPRTGTLTVAGQAFTVTQAAAPAAAPTVSLDRAYLNFAGVTTGASFVWQTSAQRLRLTQIGSGTVTWTATSSSPWLTVTPSSGSGSSELTVHVQFAPGVSATTSGAITFAFTGAANAPPPVTVRLNVIQNGAATAPFGAVDTPLNNSTGMTGSIAVTGWALDDVEIVRVEIHRDPVTGEAPGGTVYLGDAVLVEAARPDVALGFPTVPINTRGGWGYLLLTNMLPSQGNGVFRLHAIAFDREGRQTLLESRTITCTNATSTAPFGAIDTPTQGQTVSGSVNNFGWVLVPGTARTDVPGGGTVRVVIDGAVVAVPGGWTSRPDISALFPTGYSSLASTLAVHTFDTTALSNGVHTIAWVVMATNGQGAGIGSRYFTVSNGAAALTTEMEGVHAFRAHAALKVRDALATTPLESRPITGRRGFNLDLPYQAYPAEADGCVVVQAEEIDRIELRLSDDGAGQYSGHLRTGSDLGPLPIGSQLEAATGVFTWQPGVGFVGAYDLVFVRWAGGRAVARHEVRIVLNPKSSGHVGPQVVIDTPTARQEVSQPFLLAGWAVDFDQAIDSGMDAVHVWAYPVDGSDPLFVGAVATGGERPDVAAFYGSQYRDASYGLMVEGLAPGTYDLAVFAWSTVRRDFVPAKVVRVTVR